MSPGYFFHFVMPFGLALMVTLGLVPLWIAVCKRWKLFDEPDSRKHHFAMTPSMGGIAIFAGLFIAFLVFADIHDHNKIRMLFGAVLIMFFTGFFDDLMDVPPLKKLLLQICSALIIYYAGYRLVSLEGILGLYEIPLLLQLPLTVFLVVLFTNAYNFIDGVDGLAGSIGVIISSCFGALFFHYGKMDYAVLSFCVTGSLLGFLFFNFSPAKIFMGDTGSLVIGFLLSTLAIELFNAGITQPGKAISPLIVVALLFVPLYDITRVFLIRIFNGSSPFRADRNHMHHLILGFGFGHRSVSLLMASMSLLFTVIPQIFSSAPMNLLLVSFPLIAYGLIHPSILGSLALIHHRLFNSDPGEKPRTPAG